ncbi:hypothetical protein [Anaerococcus nagyae]|uniref:hypothetical protein n=1 Tax=Anaerococcus nagyae TaxID=1755241 RepID=UPI0037354D99
MQKLYLEYPEIEEIKANIISRRIQDNNTQIILDRTIFMPKNSYLLEDKGSILDLEILSIDEKRDNIIHLVKGKPNKSEVILKLNMKNRMKNLSYNTAYIIFKIVMGVFYNFKDIKLQLSEERAILKISEFYDKLDISLIEDQVNFIIAKALPIYNKQGITSIAPLGEVINNNLCFDNTSKVRAFKIIHSETFGTDIEIEFIAGNDILY